MQHLLKDIRQLYAPIQADVHRLAREAMYTEFLPADQLLPYIYCYWELETATPCKDNVFCNIVSDGCIDLFFELSHPQHSFVMGFFDKHTPFSLGKSFRYIGIRFLPTAFPQIFKTNASTLSNQIQRLSKCFPLTEHFFAVNFNRGQNRDQVKRLLDDYFTELILRTTFDEDSRLYEALCIILKNYGMLHIETDLATGVSPRQLRRLFNHYIGDTAKTFSKVVRFQNILNSNIPVQHLRESKTYLDMGYYDQAHFINDFRNFYGISPGRAFKK